MRYVFENRDASGITLISSKVWEDVQEARNLAETDQPNDPGTGCMRTHASHAERSLQH
jgi:hypothetical protein